MSTLRTAALTEEEIEKAYREIWRSLPSEFDHTSAGWIEQGIRYAERAHGIGGDAWRADSKFPLPPAKVQAYADTNGLPTPSDLSRCPRCGGPADNGHDREDPPNPYLCTRCGP